MPAQRTPRRDEAPADDETIAAIESALHSLARRLGQARLKDYIARQAGDDLDQAGIAALYVLHAEDDSLRITDLAARLGIDSPAVTRKVQQLEHLGLVVRSPDPVDGRASRLLLTRDGRRTIERLLEARRVWLEELLSEWPTPDRKEFARLLQLFAATIETDVEGRHGH